ncbi:hypothetical protein IC229_13045 [Spirosoma sp. BT702]|uniref:ABM domain-containing protein n=1 Tax=Spirosoma profusum TaxID=2771354 RepID=A0A926Y367_9BACT|nr:hypothetical protein [Spirosoma profusum]MBD2701570.1 hypothetical protein [Spirosoma profusum]
MYVRTLEGQLGKADRQEAINYVRESIAPALRRQPGFVSARLWSNPASGHSQLALVWESEQDRQRADADGFLQTLLSHLAQYYVAPPVCQHYEINVQIVSLR